MKKPSLVLVATLLGTGTVSAAEISAVLAQPVFDQVYSCTEHWQGNLKGLGDELGTDCSIQELVPINGRMWLRAYRGNGRKNSDWYGWGKNVLSPCTCEVTKINGNPGVNQPGITGKPPASFLVLKREDGVFFLLAHVAKVRVKLGDQLQSGQVIAQVGNNGYARQPHIHIGAWRGEEPLQIRFDQASMGKLFER
jgi:Peptidase family M23